MASAGAFMMLFLVSHMSTNLLLLADREGVIFGKAVDFLLTSPVIKVVQFVLYISFFLHIVIGILIEVYNRKRRPVGYHVSLKSKTSPYSRFMIHTGIIIFIFLVIHLYNFFFVKLGLVPPYGGAVSPTDFHPMIVATFTNPYYSVFYIVSLLFLGFHLKHAFQAVFQTFGLYHEKYTPIVKITSTIYAVVISGGFILIPLYFLFIY